MKYKLKLVSLIVFFSIIWYTNSVNALSWSNNTFNNTMQQENLTITSVGLLRYLAVPSTISSITHGRFNFTYPSSTIASSFLTAYWKFNEINGNANDSTGRNHNLTYNPTNVTYISGKLGNAIRMNSTSNTALRGNNSIDYAFGTGTYTIAFWFNSSKTFGGGYGGSIILKSDNNYDFIFGSGDTAGQIGWRNNAGTTLVNTSHTGYLNNSQWHRIVFRRNSTGAGGLSSWVDGVYNASGTDANNYVNISDNFTISNTGNEGQFWIDDLRIYKGNAWSDSEIVQDWNNGNGAEMFAGGNISIAIGGVSVFSDYSNSSSANITTNLNVLNFVNTYLPTCVIVNSFCNVPFLFNSSSSLQVSYSNLAFDNFNFAENSQSFNNITTSLSTETFKINITYDSGFYTSSVGTLVYNNTRYTSTSTGSGNNRIFTSSITTPSITSQTNKTFYWEMGLINSSGVNLFNSTNNTQTINPFNIDNCTTFSELILNFTERDEGTISILNATGQNTSMEVEVIISSVNDPTQSLQFNKTYSQINPAQVCLGAGTLGNGTWRLDSQVRYTAKDYVVEFYNIQNATLNNNSFPQNIDLFPLLATTSQEFLITFKDENFLVSEGALITLTRKYIGEGLFRTVEAPETNADGQVILHLVLGDIIYTIQVSKNGKLLGTFPNVIAFCTDLTIGKCEINLNALKTGIKPIDFETRSNLTYIFDFNEATRTITLTYSTLDGSTALIFMNTTVFDNRGNTTACSSQLSSSAGSLTCVVPSSVGNTTMKTDLFKDGIFVDSAFFVFKDKSAKDIFGSTGLIMLFLMYITIPLMFITSPIGIIIGAIIGSIFATMLNLYTGGTLIGVTSTIIWFIIAGGILIWKINQKE